jgi:hypothetical protein
MHFLWSPSDTGENFEEIHQAEFGPEDLKLLRLELLARAGDRPCTLDVRLVELRIRSDSLAANPVSAPAEGRTPGSTARLAAGAALAVLLLIFLLAALALRRRRGAGKAPAPTPAPAGQDLPDAGAPSLSVSCAACGKRLKVRAALAGKRVKCPQCGQAVTISGTPAVG